MSQSLSHDKFKHGEILKCCVSDFNCSDENVFELEIGSKDGYHYICNYKYILLNEWTEVTLHPNSINTFVNNYKLAHSPLNRELA